MTKFQTILLAIIAAAVAGLLYKFVPNDTTLAQGIGGLALLLIGWVIKHPADAPKPSVQADDVPKVNP